MIHVRRFEPIVIMAKKALYRVPEPHGPLHPGDVPIFGQEKMTVYDGCFVGSELVLS
jgi:hypothetical protein